MNRRGALVLLCVVVLPLCYAFYIASSLIALILEDGLDDAVTLADIAAHGNVSDALHPIPKILHQTWKNEHVPEQWQIAQFTWYAFSFSTGALV
jgi:inositol phosphorylceramide mannosyltransferase catalytic subunit